MSSSFLKHVKNENEIFAGLENFDSETQPKEQHKLETSEYFTNFPQKDMV